MKPTGKGVVTLLVFLFAIPLSVDLLLNIFFQKQEFCMTCFLSKGYLSMLPFLILYLLIASIVIFIYKKIKNRN